MENHYCYMEVTWESHGKFIFAKHEMKTKLGNNTSNNSKHMKTTFSFSCMKLDVHVGERV